MRNQFLIHQGFLRTIVERTCIERTEDGARFLDESGKEVRLTGRKTVSMNFWGFAPAFFKFARSEFEAFVKDKGNDLKVELYIPLVVNTLVRSGRAAVKVLPSEDRWFGVTYKEDKRRVMAELSQLVATGRYPTPIW